METFCTIIGDLESELSKMKDFSEKHPDQMEYVIGHCKIALDRMRELELTFSKRSNQQFIADYYTSGLSLIWKVNFKKPTHLLCEDTFRKGVKTGSRISFFDILG